MIFENVKDIDDDIHKRIEQYLKNNIENKDINHILSLIRSYLTEVKNIKEIDDWDASLKDGKIIIKITKNNDNKLITIDLDVEIRKIKINKIKSSGNSIQSFIEIIF